MAFSLINIGLPYFFQGKKESGFRQKRTLSGRFRLRNFITNDQGKNFDFSRLERNLRLVRRLDSSYMEAQEFSFGE
ncbi:hypothetical protein LFX25_11695 [Leptospira sp. FAT2]|uniref:hypothetical protein n=1 Tax=Leptospira sanjuanensis TaxID=2879643 RepID=UPI001EE97F0C|nr:hypothetical protein [Leptospira sanjuanensis]MCG6193907.1 hypothetical protein [Leptospira sanjuanensis]